MEDHLFDHHHIVNNIRTVQINNDHLLIINIMQQIIQIIQCNSIQLLKLSIHLVICSQHQRPEVYDRLRFELFLLVFFLLLSSIHLYRSTSSFNKYNITSTTTDVFFECSNITSTGDSILCSTTRL